MSKGENLLEIFGELDNLATISCKHYYRELYEFSIACCGMHWSDSSEQLFGCVIG